MMSWFLLNKLLENIFFLFVIKYEVIVKGVICLMKMLYKFIKIIFKIEV